MQLVGLRKERSAPTYIHEVDVIAQISNLDVGWAKARSFIAGAAQRKYNLFTPD